MIVLVIIGAVILILAIINWEQSNGFFKRLIAPEQEQLLTDERKDEGVVNSNGTISLGGDSSTFNHDEDYAYDDDSDYL